MLTRWKVSITWHEGLDRCSWAVEAFEDGQRVSCVTSECDDQDEAQQGLALLAHVLQSRTHPRLFE